MASVKFGGGIVAMSGSIAGNVFSHNRFGAYVRSRTVPTNPQSAGQQRARNAIGELSENWFTELTPAQRAAWGIYASNVTMVNRLGEPIKLTGFNHYIRSNSILAQQSQAQIADAPTTMSLPERDPTLAISASEATQVVTITLDDSFDWVSEDEAFMQVLVGKPVQGSRNFYDGPWKFAELLEGDSSTPLTSPQTVTAPLAIAEGNALWIQARILRADGRISEPMNVGPTLVLA